MQRDRISKTIQLINLVVNCIHSVDAPKRRSARTIVKNSDSACNCVVSTKPHVPNAVYVTTSRQPKAVKGTTRFRRVNPIVCPKFRKSFFFGFIKNGEGICGVFYVIYFFASERNSIRNVKNNKTRKSTKTTWFLPMMTATTVKLTVVKLPF